jgi:hypothetical protein
VTTDPASTNRGQSILDAHRAEEAELHRDSQPPTTVDDVLDPYASWDFIVGELDLRPTLPTLGLREDGQPLFYKGVLNVVFGDSCAGKSLICVELAAQEIRAGRHVVWIDYEDHKATLDLRLALCGVTPEQNVEFLHYCNPDDPWDDTAQHRLTANMAGFDVSLIVVDSLGEEFAIDAVSEDVDADVAPVLRRWRHLAATTGAAIVMVDHRVKAEGAVLQPSGSKRKKAAVDGVMYRVDVGKPFSKEKAGYSKLICTKDRHGNFARGDVVALFKVEPGGEAPFQLRAPREDDGDESGGQERSRDDDHITLIRRCLAVLKTQHSPVSTAEAYGLVRDRGSFRAGDKRIQGALESAARVGCLNRDKGPHGRATTWQYVRDLDQHDEDELLGRYGGLGD